MKIELWLIGKNDDYANRWMDLFEKRINKYLSFNVKEFPAGLKGKQTETAIKQHEAERILKNLSSSDFLVIMDEKGKMMDSVQFSKLLNQLMVNGLKKVVFLIGGAYGFDEKIYGRANQKMSLSKMTLSHQIARVIFSEQLYRAFTILNNEPYHHV